MKIDDSSTSGFKHKFYDSYDKLSNTLFNDDVLYPRGLGTTNKDSLLNSIFKVLRFLDKSGNEITSASSNFLEPSFFELQDTVTKKLIYFNYHRSNESEFPFVVLIIKNMEYFCSKIKENFDKINNIKSFNTPILSKVTLYKDIEKGVANYDLRLIAKGSTAVVDGKGLTIFFKDGTKIVKPNATIKVSVSSNGNGYDYSCFVNISKAELLTFQSKEIIKYKLYIFEESLNDIESENLKGFSKCIAVKK